MIDVVCAIIEHEGKILVAQRSETMKLPLKWEFPGGKVEEGEDERAALKREIKEELNLDILVNRSLQEVEYHYPEFSVRLYPFLCTAENREVKLAEHKQVVWERIENLRNYDWAAADVPVVDRLVDDVGFDGN